MIEGAARPEIAEGLVSNKTWLGPKPWKDCTDSEKIERLRSELDGWRRVCAELRERLQLFETHTHGTDGKLLVSLEQADRQMRMGQGQTYNTLG